MKGHDHTPIQHPPRHNRLSAYSNLEFCNDTKSYKRYYAKSNDIYIHSCSSSKTLNENTSMRITIHSSTTSKNSTTESNSTIRFITIL